MKTDMNFLERTRTKNVMGFTLVETMMAITIGLVATTFVMFLMIYSARANAVLFPQMNQQQNALRAMQVAGDLLRNVKYSDPLTDISISADGDWIEFESSELPEDQVARLAFQNNKLIYYPDKTDTSVSRTIARGLQDLTFSFEEQLIGIQVVFQYRKIRGFGDSQDVRLNGSFTTQIYPRNYNY